MKLFFVLALSFFCNLGLLFAQEKLAEPLFKTKILAPTLVDYCAGAIWTYSIEPNELVTLDARKGTILQRHPMDDVLPGELITALGCTKSSFVFATVRKYNGIEKLPKQVIALYRTSIPQGAAHLEKPEKLVLPEDTLVRSIQPSGDGFVLVQDSVYKTNDLIHWRKLDIPLSKDVRSKDFDEKDPFSDWQEGFMISQGRYSKALPLEDGSLMLLDPFRAHVVIHSKDSNSRWGHWGTRNGTMMFAKSFGMLPGNVVAVSDVGLKLVFFYDRGGNYLGSTGSDGANARFGYPIDIATAQNQFFVADYFGNQILAFNFKMPNKRINGTDEKKPLPKKSFTENDLFRNPDTQKTYDIVRCLNCHDGLEKFSLDKFIFEKKRHPTGVVQKTEVDLPLSEGHKVDCFTCHQAHHQTLSGVITSQYGEEQATKKLPYMLRKPLKELCLTCHEDRKSVEHNHIGMSSTKLQKFRVSVKSCTQCHQLHSAEPKLLRKTVSELCMTCHGQSRKPKSHPFGLVNDETQVNCVSCHSIHGSEKELHFSRHRTKDSEGSCLNCHKNRIPVIGKNAHLSVNPKRKQTTKWADNAIFCLNCHDPHEEKKSATKICANCHQDRVSKSHDIKVDVLFTQANLDIPAGVKLFNGRLTCTTCHDPHLPATQKSLLRPGKEQIIQLCATACHSPEGASQRYDGYHSRMGKRKSKKKED